MVIVGGGMAMAMRVALDLAESETRSFHASCCDSVAGSVVTRVEQLLLGIDECLGH